MTASRISWRGRKFVSGSITPWRDNLGKNRSVGEGVYELKIDYGPGYRVYYGLDKKTVVLLLLGGDKSSQKKDITQARTFWEDHKRRKSNG